MCLVCPCVSVSFDPPRFKSNLSPLFSLHFLSLSFSRSITQVCGCCPFSVCVFVFCNFRQKMKRRQHRIDSRIGRRLFSSKNVFYTFWPYFQNSLKRTSIFIILANTFTICSPNRFESTPLTHFQSITIAWEYTISKEQKKERRPTQMETEIWRW